ncbi:MAG: DUF2961 domain-containing protein [Treponema sp.]|nr:DUF2961 domain-containing protein [Treponema sp.]
MLRSLRLDMFWDGSEKPAVSVPLGDFFGANLGLPVSFENAFFSNPEGRSFNSFIKMPFLKSARIVLTNESSRKIKRLFYCIHYALCPLPEPALYFHAWWNRENPNRLGHDYTILPKIEGKGNFIGVNMGVRTNSGYEDSWFGEGEVKIYLDGDESYPTLCGTGTEDYIGTAWGQGTFINKTQGCLISNSKKGLFSFYRFHVSDPVCFYSDIKVQIQVMGGADKYKMLKIADKGLPIEIVSCDGEKMEHLYGNSFTLDRNSPDGWYNYFREDDFSSTAYFYYMRPADDLPPLPSIETRAAGLINE